MDILGKLLMTIINTCLFNTFVWIPYWDISLLFKVKGRILIRQCVNICYGKKNEFGMQVVWPECFLTTASSFPAAFLKAFVHLTFLGFRFLLKALWHFARQKRKTCEAVLKLGKLNVYSQRSTAKEIKELSDLVESAFVIYFDNVLSEAFCLSSTSL